MFLAHKFRVDTYRQFINFLQYLKERFPAHILLVVCLLTVVSMNFFIKTLLLLSNVSARGGVISAVEMPGEYGSIGVSNLTNLSREIRVGGVISSLSEIEVTKIIFLAVIYMQFLFHMRVLDEVKDFGYDSKNHPNRPVQRGVISLGQLNFLLKINVFLMFMLAFGFSLFSESLIPLSLWFIAMLYSMAMFKNFGPISEFLSRYNVLDLVIHELIFFPLFAFFLVVFLESKDILTSSQYFSILLYEIFPVFILEIGRKVNHRINSKGIITDDTYAFKWGQERTLNVLWGIGILSSIVLFLTSGSFLLASIGLIAFCLVGLAVSVKAKQFVLHFSKEVFLLLVIFMQIAPVFSYYLAIWTG